MKSSVVLVGLLPLFGFAQDTGFYKDKERGWFWHEQQPSPDEPKELEPEQPQVAAPQNATIALDSEWLKANIPVLLSKAMDNPSEENLAAYAYAQRLAMDMSSRFSSRMIDFMSMETLLDESNRRPTSSMALKEFNKERSSLVNDAMQDVKQKTKGIFFFFASDCGFCHKMVPILNEFSDRYGIEILGISLDGGIIPGMENFHIVEDMNSEVATQFNVSITPTLHLVMPNNESSLIVEGLKTLPDFEDKLLLAARKVGALNEELYVKTRNVREINVYKNEEGSLIAEKERLETDPGYLAEMLRMQLKDSSVFGTKIVKRTGQ